jgi:hypothetical protein
VSGFLVSKNRYLTFLKATYNNSMKYIIPLLLATQLAAQDNSEVPPEVLSVVNKTEQYILQNNEKYVKELNALQKQLQQKYEQDNNEFIGRQIADLQFKLNGLLKKNETDEAFKVSKIINILTKPSYPASVISDYNSKMQAINDKYTATKSLDGNYKLIGGRETQMAYIKNNVMHIVGNSATVQLEGNTLLLNFVSGDVFKLTFDSRSNSYSGVNKGLLYKLVPVD